MHPHDLAWSLANAVRERLSDAEQVTVHVAIGSGDISEAIQQLTKIAARERTALSRSSLAALENWWTAHGRRTSDLDDLIALVAGPPLPAT